MSVVNFTITKPLEQKIKEAIKGQGFSSKAEFFRFAAMVLINSLDQNSVQQSYKKTMREHSASTHNRVI